MNNIIRREAENLILENIKLFPVVGIICPRQVGKTTMAKSIIIELKKILNFSLPADKTRIYSDLLTLIF